MAVGVNTGITGSSTIHLWDVSSGQVQDTLVWQPSSEFIEGVSSIAFSPDGLTLASGSRETVRLWDVSSGQVQATLVGHTDWIQSVAFSPDGLTLASGSRETVRLWDVSSGQVKATLQSQTGPIESVAFSPYGQILASSGSWDGTVRLWDVSSGQEQAALEGHTVGVSSIAFSPDGLTLASGSYDRTVRLWDVPRRKQHALLKGHTSLVRSVAFAPNGQILASAGYDGTILLWDLCQWDLPCIPSDTQGETVVEVHLPEKTALQDNYPNPFNSTTRIPYRLANPGPVRLEIYNVLGQRVRTLVDKFQAAGIYQASWDARDKPGRTVASGVYLARLIYPGGVQTRPLLYLW